MDQHSRRTVLRSTATLLFASFAGCSTKQADSGNSLGSPSSREDRSRTTLAPRPLSTTGTWKQYQSDPANTGAVLSTTGVPESGEVYWKVNTGSGTPIIADPLLFNGAQKGEDNATISGIQRKTGQIRWMGPDRTTPFGYAVFGENVCIPNDGILVLNGKSGETELNIPLQYGTAAGPLKVYDDTVLLATHGSERNSPKIFSASISEDYVTMEKKFENIGEINACPAVSGETVYVASADGKVVALDRESRVERWRSEVGDEVSVPPVIGDEKLFVVTDQGRIYTLKETDGSLKWETRSSPMSGGIAHGSDCIYYVCKDGLRKFDSGSGEEIWRYSIAEPTYEATAPTVGHKAVYFGTGVSSEKIFSIGKNSGELLWSHQFSTFVEDSDVVQGGVMEPVSIVEGGLFVQAADGLYAFGPA